MDNNIYSAEFLVRQDGTINQFVMMNELTSILEYQDRGTVERILTFLQDWNKKRPAGDK